MKKVPFLTSLSESNPEQAKKEEELVQNLQATWNNFQLAWEQKWTDLASRQEAISNSIQTAISTIPTIQERLQELESSMKAFLDMQCMIGEETVNAFEIIINRLNHMDKSMTQHLVKPPEAPPTEAKAQSGRDYAINANNDRKQFLLLLRYLGDDESTTGIGKIEAPHLSLTMTLTQGRIALLTAEAVGNQAALQTAVQQWEEQRVKDWESDSEENLIALLAGAIQNKTQYLAGLTRVLHKLSKKQLIEKLQANSKHLLEKTSEGNIVGEALFYYLLACWPDDGKATVPFQFAKQSIAWDNVAELITVRALLAKAERILTINLLPQ